jgi:hypothetical protein
MAWIKFVDIVHHCSRREHTISCSLWEDPVTECPRQKIKIWNPCSSSGFAWKAQLPCRLIDGSLIKAKPNHFAPCLYMEVFSVPEEALLF